MGRLSEEQLGHAQLFDKNTNHTTAEGRLRNRVLEGVFK